MAISSLSSIEEARRPREPPFDELSLILGGNGSQECTPPGRRKYSAHDKHWWKSRILLLCYLIPPYLLGGRLVLRSKRQQQAVALISDDEKGVSCQPTTGYTRLSSVSTSHVQTVQPQHHQHTDRRSTNNLFEKNLTRRSVPPMTANSSSVLFVRTRSIALPAANVQLAKGQRAFY